MRRVLLLLILTISVLLTGCGKPVITEECVMNGMGQGTCSFTNTGGSEGSMCGTVVVVKPANKSSDGRSQRAESNTFCSGTVSADTTSQISFNVPRVSEMCSSYGRSWDETCDFGFTSSSGSGAGWIRNLLIFILVAVVGGLTWRYLPMLKDLYKKNSRKCPFCAESVKPQAIICKSCGRDIPEQVTVQKTTDQFEGASAESTVEVKNLLLTKLELIKLWWKQHSLGGKLITASWCMALSSMFMNWTLFDGGPFGSGPSAYDIMIFVGCWLYPFFIIFKNRLTNFVIAVASPTASILWGFYDMYEIHSFNAWVVEKGIGAGDNGIGLGLWFYMLASVVLFVGAALYKPAQKMELEAAVAQ